MAVLARRKTVLIATAHDGMHRLQVMGRTAQSFRIGRTMPASTFEMIGGKYSMGEYTKLNRRDFLRTST